MSKFQMPDYSEIEAFILKWTFISVFLGVTLIFIMKILFLFKLYITSGKIATDLAGFLWELAKALPKNIFQLFGIGG